MLVVAKDIAHASLLRSLIDSDQFRGGAYKGKVIEVHTKTKGDEADETIEKLISLEYPDNIVEIVIHVNMLKEGWDVANIYTIAPIRSSAAQNFNRTNNWSWTSLAIWRKDGKQKC